MRDGMKIFDADGRYTQSHKTLHGRQQEAVRWTTEAMREKYGPVVDKGFAGASVAETLANDCFVGLHIHTHSWDRAFDHRDYYPYYALAADPAPQ